MEFASTLELASKLINDGWFSEWLKPKKSREWISDALPNARLSLRRSVSTAHGGCSRRIDVHVPYHLEICRDALLFFLAATCIGLQHEST